ncbi:DUF6796 family protein [Sphingobacterium corticibacter]|uniref:DUF998 domain-containing protein n=1 Tax=Sphingobacterium corticibacter TaxID=2171749 RepID=A0A2T8HG96_9SPHI|nr:DUF6796 family protein [Sphingobacterium corticibacter]PVH24424.1 hypothetical protein DC487_14280 [Sphingobacterium corticibacter]
MTYSTKIKWAFVSALIGSILWVIGDVFVAGFDVDPSRYPLFSTTYADQIDIGISVLMLEGSTARLMFGGLVASMSAVLFLPAVWLSFQFISNRQSFNAWGNYYLLILSVVLMPLGHSVFFYVGEISKAIYNTDVSAHPYLLNTARAFTMMLYIAWGIAIFVLMAGWLWYSITVFRGKTALPRWAGLITPVWLTLYQMPLRFVLPMSELRGWLIAAGFNISYLLYFALLWLLFRHIPLKMQEKKI